MDLRDIISELQLVPEDIHLTHVIYFLLGVKGNKMNWT